MKNILGRALTALDDFLHWAGPFWQLAIVLACAAMIVAAVLRG